ncbi:quinone oxidoreductase family protein [Luteipulveratus flavus]|uniref:Quinone oxidoreductase n=1 Tax=Luteipulveratus flavus TaxID=3031728 RepID=A0ABT6CA76_9MICO|nr:quinone oxidoreductase [Luteipulveratus sp. YIM 133296]MDF8265423.1 quinone oxidoreductase [Luteipulveratus sp. YIM 133296]
MTSTEALVVTAPDQLELQQVEVPDPEQDQVQVRVAAVGVNFIEVYQRQGVYDVPLPFRICSEGAGEVVGTGERVAWAQVPGSAAQVINAPRDALVPVPDGVDLEVAAAAMLQGMTAHYLVNSTYSVKPGDVALVHAAAGGVGRLLVQMITERGGEVIATAGTQGKRDIALALGARAAIDYTQDDDLAEQVRDANDGRGVDVAYDGVGKATFDASLGSLRPRGMLVLFGGSSGQVPPLDLQRLNSGGSLYVTRPTLGHYIATREELLLRSGEVLESIRTGSLDVEIGGRYPLAEASQAYADLEGRRTVGKLLLVP